MIINDVGNGDVEAIIDALDRGETLDVVNVNGWSPAMFAVAGGHIDALNLLIESGVDLNLQDIDGKTPLMLAVEQVHLSV